MRLGGAREVLRELIELKIPKLPIVLDPLGGLPHRCGDERRASHTAISADVGESCALEHANVLRDGRERHVEARGELADRPLAAGEPRYERPSCGISEGAEGAVEAGRVLVNHVV